MIAGHCPHWSYVTEGKKMVKYDDGQEETVGAGEVFYWASGHTVIVREDVKLIDFSPSKDFDEVTSHVGKIIADLGGKTQTYDSCMKNGKSRHVF